MFSQYSSSIALCDEFGTTMTYSELEKTGLSFLCAQIPSARYWATLRLSITGLSPSC